MNLLPKQSLLCMALAVLASSAAAEPVARPGTASAPQATGAVPGDSVYQLAVPLTDQLGRLSQLAERRGHPVLVSMFYTSCQFVCPMLVDALRDTEAKLSADERAQLSILMISFDPDRDTVAVLKQTAAQRQLDSPHWTLARTDAAHVRKLAAVLGIQYRALKNGDFNHTTALILLDADGRIVGRSTQLGDADPDFVKIIKTVVRRSSQ